MTFDEVLAQVQELLQREKRVSYRGLKRRFALDDEYLEDLKEELIGAKQLATDEEGRLLVWRGAQEPAAAPSAPLSSQSPTLPTAPRSADAERRQLTVLFCDLVGSTTLSTQLDPEELREVVQAYQETCTTVIQRYEGHIAQHLGDGLLVYFGYPAAHEDDPQRAVRTALEIIEALHHRNLRLPHPLQVRIGIHTGLVVVGEIGSSAKREVLALGETPNLAARLQGLAEPDTVVISGATYHLVQGLFACQALAPQEVKGFPTPLSVHRVLGASGAQSRFEVAMQAGLTPLVGRDEELALLRRRWQQTQESSGQVVLLSGEPGIGKSRLVQELKDHVAQDGAVRIEYRCSPYHQNSAFYPLIEHLQRVLQFTTGDTSQAKFHKLAQTLSRYRFPQNDTVPLLAALLSLPQPEGSPSLSLTPQQQKQKTLDTLVRWLFEEAERVPVYTVWEDLHWADPSTLEFLTVCLDQTSRVRMLMILTGRPEFTPPWTSRSHVSQLVLSRLGQQQSSAIVEGVTSGKPLPLEVVQQIANKTDGVPLFVEELTKMVMESGLVREVEGRYELNGPLPPLAIPSTLQDSLMARLDRLASVRDIAQMGATIGREFTYELLQAVSPLNAESLQQGLKQLVEAELVYQSGLPPQARYLFKHALVQETAYQSLLKSRRQQLHQQVARVLEEQFRQIVETQPELVAHHYTEAGLSAQAIPYWQQAGQRAVERSAHVEAISHLTRGLELLKTLPDTPERTQQELTLLIALGTPLVITKSFGAPEAEQTYARARELCQHVGETPQLFPVLWGLHEFYLVRGDLPTGRKTAEELLHLAQSMQDPSLILEAHHALWGPLVGLGEYAQAREHIERGIALYNPKQHHSLTFLYGGHDPGGCCWAGWFLTLWALGYADQALQRSHEALALAQELSHPASLALALDCTARLHHHRQEVQLTQERAEAAVALSTEHGLGLFLAWATIPRGWALAAQGQAEEGIGQMRQGLTVQQTIGSGLWRPLFLGMLAEAYGKGGQAEEGLSVVAEALEIVHKTEQRHWAAELYRLKGELTLQKLQASSSTFQVQAIQKTKSKGRKAKVSTPHSLIPNSQAEAEAEACFLKAIEIARHQQAKTLELRAVTSLARLWQQQDKRDEAHQMLSELYGWFTEGFDTKDLQEAKALLEELT